MVESPFDFYIIDTKILFLISGSSNKIFFGCPCFPIYCATQNMPTLHIVYLACYLAELCFSFPATKYFFQ